MTHPTNPLNCPFHLRHTTHGLLYTGQLVAGMSVLTHGKSLELQHSANDENLDQVLASIERMNGILENALEKIVEEI